MWQDLLRTPEFILAVAVFVTIFAVWGIALIVRQRRRGDRDRQIASRLMPEQPEQEATRVLRLWREGREETTTVPKAINWQSVGSRLSRLCQEAGWEISTWALVLGAMGIAAMILLISLVLTNSLLPGVGVAAAAGIIFWIYLKHRITTRVALFEKQLVDALQIAVRSLRAGHPLTSAFQVISEEMGPPVGRAFAEICQHQALGMSLVDAIERVSSHSASLDMRLFATSVVIHLKSGGNLADMMDRLAFLIRERMRLNRKVRVLLAQVQLSKRILLAMPFVLFVILFFFNPNYMRSLYETTVGTGLLIAGGICLLLGTYTMNRLARLRY